MATGTVKFYNDTKGFGFITPDDGSTDLFVHITGVIGVDSLMDNDRVSFDVTQGREGKMQAVNVQLLTNEAPMAAGSQFKVEKGGAHADNAQHDALDMAA
jgi:CspA family cold shock protein